MKYEVSQGKTILFGEHAVVYGEPGIAAPLNSCKVQGVCESYEEGFLRLETDLGKSEGEIKEYKDLGKTLIEKWEECSKEGDFSELFEKVKESPEKTWLSIVAYCFDLPEEFSGYIKTKSSIPIGAGAGSSAAVGATICKCISSLLGNIDEKEIFNASLLCEKMFHGTPSGIDSAVACYGKPLVFRKGKGFEFFKIKSPLEIFIIYTHKPEKTTGELVQQVRSLEENYREPRIKKVGKLVEKARIYLENNDLKEMLYCVKENQQLLSELGVSSNEIDEITTAINKENNMAAKLTGAGGGGLVIGFYLPNGKTNLKQILEEFGYKETTPNITIRPKTYWQERIY